MKRLMIVILAVCGTLAGVQAAPPGPLDGQDIPTDFAAARLVGVQTNYTGVGDVTALELVPVYSEGSELDALYLAKDSTYLYVGLAGNLLEVGNPFVILIDNEFDFGQTELRTEGVGGPPFALQLAGREVDVNTNGTPEDGSDDTYTLVPDSGTLLPNCGDPGFTGWDYALAIDGANGTMYAHEYLLYDIPIGTASADDVCHFGDDRGRVPCDPTPDNPGDSSLSVYALRNHVAESPLGDGNEIFEGGEPQFGYQRGGFDNSNITGVTEADATDAALATTGVEIAIPLANIGPSGLFGSETINLLILTIDADEYQSSSVSDGFGTVLNQALPSLTGSCDPPESLGLRPDLSTIASCLSVNLSTLSYIDTGAVLEGEIVVSDYDTGAPILTQQCPTSGGDRAQLADILQPVQDGSELDTLFAENDDEFLYLGLTGNLQAGGTSINLFMDADPEADSGEHVLDFDTSSDVFTPVVITDFGDFNFTGRYERWLTATITSGPDDYRVESTDFGGGYYDINPNMDASGAIALTLDVTLNPANLADIIRVILVDEDLTERVYRFDVPANGTYSLAVPLSDYTNDNNPGTVPGLDLSDLTFFHITGGFNHGNPGVTFDVTFNNMSLVRVVPGAAAIVTMNGDELANGPLDVLNNGRFPSDAPVKYDAAYGINVGYEPHLAYVDYFDLENDLFSFRGAVVPESGDSTLFDNPGGQTAENPNGLEMAFNNWNTDGIIGCESDMSCFLDDAETVAALAGQAGTGVELAIPLADLGLTAGDLPRAIHLWTAIGTPLGEASNQSLPSMRNTSGEGNQVINPGKAPVNFTDPTAAPSAGAVLSDFSNFALTDTYGHWTTATFTSGPDDFRVQSTDWGGGYYDVDPNADASSATTMVLDLTLNPANLTDKVVVVLTDEDGTERVYRFENLTNGPQTLTMELSRYINDNNPGTVPGLDLSDLSFFHIAGAYHHGDPGVTMDVTFDNLALVGEPRNFEARAARICLATVAGDGDCDGDNDLADFALLQQCFGREADPVLPMECEQLDLLKDGVIDIQDMVGFADSFYGPSP